MRCYFQFHVKQNNYLSAEHVILTVYRLQSSLLCKINGVLTLGMPPRVGILTCRRQIPCVSPLNLGRGSRDVVDRCFTHKFLYYSRTLMLLHTKLNNSKCISGIYLLITMIYKTSAYYFRSCIAAKEQCQLY